jgi:hypothetical protein
MALMFMTTVMDENETPYLVVFRFVLPLITGEARLGSKESVFF